MKIRRHEPESPWSSFADVLSGMLFVFVITTFWYALQQVEAKTRTEEERQKLVGGDELMADITAEDGPLTTCLRDARDARRVLEVFPDPAHGRMSLYLYAPDAEVAWFVSGRTEFEDRAKAEAALARLRSCVEQLITPQPFGHDLSAYQIRVYLEGHTDWVPLTGSETTESDSNWELSSRRAAKVLRILDESPDIHAAVDNGVVSLTAVGLADREPAWWRICRSAKPGTSDEAVCNRLKRTEGDLRDDELRAALDEARTAAAKKDGKCGELDPSRTASAEELLRAWANGCATGFSKDDERLGMLRRVDLRLELEPKR